MHRSRPSRLPIVALLAGGALLLVAGISAWSLLRGDAAEPPPAAASDAAAPVAATAGEPRPASAAPAPAEASDPGVPHTELPIRLLATIVRENAKLSLATIEDDERTMHEVLSEGDALRAHPQASVVRIERGRILLDNDGVREQLVIDPTDRAPLEVAYDLPPDEVRRRREMGRRLRELTEAGSDYRDVLGEGERSGLLEEGDVSAVYGEDGEMIGVQFDAIRSGGVYDQLGLRNGDVVTDINGIKLSEPTAAAKLMAAIAGSDEVTAVVEGRDGSSQTVSMPTAELIGAIQDIE